MGLICGGNVQHNALARHVESSTQSAAVKRVERFFKEEELSIEIYAITLVCLLNFSGQFKLRLDRTNWKFGIKDINYLVLSWHISEQISLPLLFIELDKAGNSNTSERQDLIKIFVRIFGENRIEELVGDREFIGDAWIRYLHENGIPFVIRVKENMKVPWSKKSCCVRDFLINWDINRPRLIEKDMFGTTVYFACKKMENRELLIVMTNKNMPASRVLAIYKQRWTIESLFKNLKTAGFNWENTHMTDPARLIKLLIVMGLATLLVYLIGARQKIPFRKTVNCPLRSYFRAGLLQMQYLMSKSIFLTIDSLASLLSSASILIQKSGG